jgi:hypothetical protein
LRRALLGARAKRPVDAAADEDNHAVAAEVPVFVVALNGLNTAR